MLNRRELIVAVTASALGVSALVQGTSRSSAQAAQASRVDEWGVTLRGAATNASAVALPPSFDPAQAANARLWLRQEIEIAQAMAAIGADYTFVYFWERAPKDKKPKASPSATSTEGQALYGSLLGSSQAGADSSAEPYRWDVAGIVGRVVHESGMDAAN